MTYTTIAVVMTCHNRAELTLQCLHSLFSQAYTFNCKINVFLVDDGSTDDTGKRVIAKFPEVNVIYGSGDLFWNRGMHLSFMEAMNIEPDFFWWLNDDVVLFEHALELLFHTFEEFSQQRMEPIIVGSLRDTKSDALVYGGVRRRGLLPLSFEQINPNAQPQECDTMAGTCVFISKSVVDNVGLVDPVYLHYFSDYDYGFRAKQAGHRIWLVPGFIGTCAKNPLKGTWKDTELPVFQRIQLLRSVKGIYPPDWFPFIKKYGGIFWPYYALSPYMKVLLSSAVAKIRKIG